MTKALRAACLIVILAFCVPVKAGATSRIKDLTNIEGVRQNQLIGYGPVSYTHLTLPTILRV